MDEISRTKEVYPLLYAWIYYENRLLDGYLPDTGKWTEQIPIWQSESKWDRDYYLQVDAVSGKYEITPPDRFRWTGSLSERGAVAITPGVQYSMKNGEYVLNVVFAQAEKKEELFHKYFMQPGSKIQIGRNEDCVLQIAPELVTAGRRQGVFERTLDGVCTYTDTGSNGSYLNNTRMTSNATRLRFGDVITIPPGIKLVYLGDVLAVNHRESFVRIGLTEREAPEVRERRESTKDPSVQIQFHRAPRFLQKPNTEAVQIGPPLEKQDQQRQPLWMTLGPSATMILPMLMGSYISSSSGRGFMGAGIAMVGTASALAVFWGILNNRHRQKQAVEYEEKRQAKYGRYLQEAEQYLAELSEREHQRLLETCPSVEECARLPQNDRFRLWERMPQHGDFLFVRLGLGNVPLPNAITVDAPKLTMVDDPLRNEPRRLAKAYGSIANTPVTLSLRQESVVGILGTDLAGSLAQGILLQLAALHSYHDVRIAVLSDPSSYSNWHWARWLPHVFASEDRELRMVVSEASAIQDVLTHLDEILSMRSERDRDAELPVPHYVIFCTNPELLDNKPLIRHLLGGGCGMTLFLLAPSMEYLPKECHVVLDATSQSGAVYTSDGDIQEMEFEYPNTALLQAFSRMIAPLRVKDAAENAAIPAMVSFLDIYEVRRVEQLDVFRFWDRNRVYEGLRSTIGLGAGSRRFDLDISDKAHGPHGLIAGTTGSGKSVMLQTYILSLALNYHPDQIRFILIDYKGGGMADAFRKLPHVTGIIDNLQTENTIARALASIQGEIHRRERVFRDADVNNIDDYIRFYYDDPARERLPHLIIIVDEFAELKTDQPEFMRELVSASRVGRSLGVHLILSTQKPSNSVSDEIWANSNFRICLRVQTRGDSMDMLHRPDAAYLKARGRCYVQVGNDEIYEQVQTSYSGLAYDPNAPSETELPHLLDNAGHVVATKRKATDSSVRKQDQMGAVLERIVATAQELRLPAYRMWMEELAPKIYLGDVPGALGPKLWSGPNDGTQLRIFYGMADDVENQRHFPIGLDFTADHNFLVVGISGSGKTIFVQTVAMALAMRYDPGAVNLYILSLSSLTLRGLAELPHVGEVIFGEEVSELRRLLQLLEREDARRRALFAEISTDSFLAYNQSQSAAGKEIVPAIVVLVDRFLQLMEMLGEDEEYLQKFMALVQEGSGRGIYFVATAIQMREVPTKLRDAFQRIALQINDRTNYTEIIGMRMPAEMPDLAPFPGRGLVRGTDHPYEMQVALASAREADADRAAELSEIGKRLTARWQGNTPLRIPRIPEAPDWNAFCAAPEYQAAQADVWRFPLAYDMESGLPLVLQMENSFSFLVTGPRQSGKTNLLRLIAHQWRQRGAELVIIGDSAWNITCRQLETPLYEVGGEALKAFFERFSAEVSRRKELRQQVQAEDPRKFDETVRSFSTIVFLIDDFDRTFGQCPADTRTYLTYLVQNAAKYNVYLFASVSHQGYAQVRTQEPLMTLSRQGRGIAMGGRMNDCNPWGINAPLIRKNRALPRGEAFLVLDGTVSHIVVPKAPEV